MPSFREAVRGERCGTEVRTRRNGFSFLESRESIVSRGLTRTMTDATPLPPLACPVCRRPLEARAGSLVAATCWQDCLRRCEDCGVGFSNARKGGVRIWREATQNVPMQVREHVLETLQLAVNSRNRNNKRSKFGFSSSEDAVTWTVFRYLQRTEQLAAIADIVGHVVNPQRRPTLLLWGVELTDEGPTPAGVVAQRLARASTMLGERSHSRTEPDVILDFGADGALVIEAKYRSGNDHLRADHHSWVRYIHAGVRDASGVRASGLYELTRNWRFAAALADGRPLTVVNLGMPALADDERVLAWVKSLDLSAGGHFATATWAALLKTVRLEPWMKAYCVERELTRESS